MKEKLMKSKNSLLALSLMPFVCGCQAGAIGLNSLGNLFAFSGGGAESGAGLLASVGGGGGVATIVNPEPASMLLMGGGLIAMKYLKSKIKAK